MTYWQYSSYLCKHLLFVYNHDL
ncbi:SWIM zinc finger family protein [uncultured Ligilactobacillus sp.]